MIDTVNFTNEFRIANFQKKSLAATALAISATAVLATFVPAVGVPLGLFVAKITFAKVGAGTLL